MLAVIYFAYILGAEPPRDPSSLFHPSRSSTSRRPPWIMILPISHLVKRAEYDGNVRLVTGYVPSLALALLATLLFGILCICAWTREPAHFAASRLTADEFLLEYLRIKRQRYMLTLCIGLATLCVGRSVVAVSSAWT